MIGNALVSPSGYVDKYLAAFDRTEAVGLQARQRLLVQKDCEIKKKDARLARCRSGSGANIARIYDHRRT